VPLDNLTPMSSRREEKEQRRQERLAREQREREAARKRRLYSIVVGAILAVAAIAAVAVAVTTGGGDGSGTDAGGVPAGQGTYDGGTTPPPQIETDLVKAARAADCRLSNPPIEGRLHVDNDKKVRYKTNPPTSGDHNPQPAGDGVYDRPVTADDLRHLVHTLEHGRIEIQYDPALRKRDVDRLGGLYNEDPYHMVLFPNNKMEHKVAATAWGHLIGCEKITNETFDALRAFRDRYRDQGPEQAA
jgi:hypothetical protein